MQGDSIGTGSKARKEILIPASPKVFYGDDVDGVGGNDLGADFLFLKSIICIQQCGIVCNDLGRNTFHTGNIWN